MVPGLENRLMEHGEEEAVALAEMVRNITCPIKITLNSPATRFREVFQARGPMIPKVSKVRF